MGEGHDEGPHGLSRQKRVSWFPSTDMRTPRRRGDQELRRSLTQRLEAVYPTTTTNLDPKQTHVNYPLLLLTEKR